MALLTTLAGYLIAFAMFLSGFAPLLPDTTPGSERSVVVAVSGVILAVAQLLVVVGLSQLHAFQKAMESLDEEDQEEQDTEENQDAGKKRTSTRVS